MSYKSNEAHLQSSGQSIMFTNVDLHTVQEYHDNVYGELQRKRAPACSAAIIVGESVGFCAVDRR